MIFLISFLRDNIRQGRASLIGMLLINAFAFAIVSFFFVLLAGIMEVRGVVYKNIQVIVAVDNQNEANVIESIGKYPNIDSVVSYPMESLIKNIDEELLNDTLVKNTLTEAYFPSILIVYPNANKYTRGDVEQLKKSILIISGVKDVWIDKDVVKNIDTVFENAFSLIVFFNIIVGVMFFLVLVYFTIIQRKAMEREIDILYREGVKKAKLRMVFVFTSCLLGLVSIFAGILMSVGFGLFIRSFIPIDLYVKHLLVPTIVSFVFILITSMLSIETIKLR